MTRRTDRREEPTDEYLNDLDAWWARQEAAASSPTADLPQIITEIIQTQKESEEE